MKKVSKIFLVMVLFVALAFSLGACEKNKVSHELEKGVTIKVYSWWDPAHQGIVRLKEGFEAKYSDYEVTLEFVKISSYYKTMLTKLAGAKLAGGGGEAIDVMMLAFDKLPLFAQNDAIMALDDYADKKYLNDLYPSVREGLYFEGKLYALARDVTTWATILNTDMFTEHGIALPNENWTMEDFVSICNQFAAKGVAGYAFNNYTDLLSPWVYLYGGSYYDAENNVSTINSTEAIKGLTTLYKLIQSGGSLSNAQTIEYGSQADAFVQDRAAMVFGGLSEVNNIENKGGHYTVLPLPKGVNGHQSHTFTNCWTVPSVSTKPAWAWKVIEYFSGAEGQAIAVEAGMGLPATPKADIDAWKNETGKAFRKYFVEALGYENTKPYSTDTFGPNWDANFKVMMADRVFDKPGMTDQEVKDAIIAINDLLTYYLQGGV